MNFIQSINGSPNGMFGRSLAINKYQNVLAVGEPGYNSNIGAVKIYNWNGTTWNIMGNTIVGNLSGDSTGYSVALNDNGTIVAFGEIGYDPPSYSNNGRIRVFYWNPSISDWSKYGNDLLGILGVNNNFGSSVSISNDGNTIACGAPNYNSNSGYVYIYNYNNGNWNSIGNMAGIDANALTGSSVKLSNNGNIIAISSPQYNNGYYNNLGYTQIYTYNGGSTWNQIGTNFANAYSFFTKVPGTYCRVTSTSVYAYPQGTVECWVKMDPSAVFPSYDICLLGNAGSENRTMWCSSGGRLITQNGYLLLLNYSTFPNTIFGTKFKVNDGLWHHIALVFTSNATNNETLYVDGVLTPGTTSILPINITNVNNVFTNSFTTTTTNFTSSYNFSIGGCSTQPVVCQAPIKTFNARIWNVPQTQSNIALYMNQIITSAPGLRGVYHINQTTGSTVINQANIADVNTRATITGANYEFVYDTPTGVIGINGNNTYSGSSISLANNGNTIAIGEPGPVNGRLGNVRVFNRNYSNWVLVGNTINTTTGNNFGSSVSLTEDGTYLSVGAYSSNIAGNSGYVRLYNYNNNSWNQVGSTINGSANQTMGYSTALSYNLLAVGAPSINTNGNGSVSIYQIITNAIITVNSSYSQSIGNNSIFNLNASSTNNETPIQYTSINPLIANVDSYGNITIYSLGNTRIQLFQPNTTNYLTVTANTIVYVNKNLPTLSIQNFNVAYLTPSFSILPNIITNNSEAPTYTYNSTYPNVANIVAGVLTIGNAGTANISITQSETGNYLSVTANTTVTVSPLQSILNYTIPSNIKYKDLSFNLLANSNNQSATILYSASNPLIANVTSTGNVIVGNAGTANINLTIVGTNNYTGISSNILITVNKIEANLGYPNSSYTKNYKDQSFNLNANTTNTDNNIILYTTDNPIVANVNTSGNVTIGNTGTANITLTRSATTNYNSVTANILITVNKLDANLGYPNSSYTKNYKDQSFNLNANTTNTDSNIILYTTDNTSVAIVNTTGNVTIGNTGTANITLRGNATTNYNSVSANILITVNPIQANLGYLYSSYTKNYLDPSFQLNANTTNTDSTEIVYTTDNPIVANVNTTGNVTIGNAGTANIQISGSATTNYNSVTANILITVNPIQANLGYPYSSYTKKYLDPPFQLDANTTNTDSTQILYSTDNPSVANVNTTGNVIIGNAGTANIQISGNATTNYNSVTANIVITVNKIQANLEYLYSSYTKNYLDESFQLNANTTNTDSTEILYSTDNSSVAVVNTTGNVTIGNAGTSNITLTGNATTNYNLVTANIAIIVNKIQANLGYPYSSYTKNYLDPSFNLNANTTNTDSTQLLYSTDNLNVAIVNSNGNVIIGNAGTANITLTGNATTNYYPVSANILISVNPIEANLVYPYSSYTKNYLDPSFNLNANTTNTDSTTILYSTDNTTVATVDITTGTVTIGNTGTANISLIGNATTNYYPVNANILINVNPIQANLVYSYSSYTKNYLDPSFNLNVNTTNTDSPQIIYSTDNPIVAIVDTMGNITIGNTGTANITLIGNQTINYYPVNANILINVNPIQANLVYPYVIYTKNYKDLSFNLNANTTNTDNTEIIYSTDNPIVAIVDTMGNITIGNAGIANIILTGNATTNYRSITANIQININPLQANLEYPYSIYTKNYKDPSFPLNANTTNTDSIEILYSTDNPDVAIVDTTGNVTIGNTGTANIILTGNATPNYTSTTANIRISVSLVQANLVYPYSSYTKNYKDPPFPLNANTNNTDNNQILYSTDNPGVAIVDTTGNVTIGNAGTSNIILTGNATINYSLVTANILIVVNKLQANLEYPYSSYTKNYKDLSFNLNANTNNTENTTILYSTDNELVANVNASGNVTIGNAGTANITLTGNETTNYYPVSANILVIVNRLQANIFYPYSIYNEIYKGTKFNLNAYSNNIENSQILYSTSNPIVANVDTRGNITIGNAGTANITLTQNRTTNYNEITANIIINVARLESYITVVPVYVRKYLDNSFNLKPRTNNTEIPIQYISQNPTIADVDIYGNVIIGNTGNTRITLVLGNTNNYLSTTAITNIYVNKRSSNITVDSSFTRTYGTITPFNVNANKTNPETPIQYTSLNTGVATVDSYGNIIVGNAGNATIQLYQPETVNYFVANSNTVIYVNKKLPQLTIDSSFIRIYQSPSFDLTPYINTTNTDANRVIQYSTSNDNIATVVDGIVTIGEVGSASITIKQLQTQNFMEVITSTIIYVLKKQTNIISLPSITTINGTPPFGLNVTTNNLETPIIYSSSNTEVVTITNGMIIIKNVGTTTIIITQENSTNFLGASTSTIIYVKEKPPYKIPTATSLSNQFAYGVKAGNYTIKDKTAYPVRYTPVFSKITGEQKQRRSKFG